MAVSTDGRLNRALNWLLRQYRWLLPRHDSLARSWDRIEAAVALAVLVLALLAAPTAGLAGAAFHSREMAVATAQQAQRHPATAVLLAPSPPAMVTDVGTVSQDTQPVAAQWRLPDGTERTGTVQAGPGMDAGQSVPIWLNGTGDPVSAPMSGVSVLGLAVGFGALLWAGATVVLLLVYWGTRSVLDRLRAAEWAREWENVPWKPRSKGDSR
ncbi:MAG TPA: hypothetical protein VFG87_14355 [Amycolatopsis sp.]|nr:hypothetical protein [Amycolatopsis sp.]